MVKILLYGGCHALVLRDLLEAHFESNAIETALLINFQLIGSGTPFPAALLDWCDVVVFSPIENKGEYNTDLLAEKCRAAGIRAIPFPWMEWHGYCPGAEKGTFKGRFQWFYPELLRMATGFDRFDSFVKHVVAHFPSDDLIDETLAKTSRILAAAEDRHAMEVKITDFIAAHHRSSRLFLISDHPSLAIYMHVLQQIAAIIGLPPIIEATASAAQEPQWRWRTPILPRVAERLKLAFSDTDWVDDELIPDRRWPLETYLSLYFYSDSVILGPIGTARLHVDDSTLSQDAPLDLGTRIFAKPLPGNQDAGLDAYAYLETLSGREVALDRDAAFKIDSNQWRSTWHF